jgi:hypothetical protein
MRGCPAELPRSLSQSLPFYWRRLALAKVEMFGQRFPFNRRFVALMDELWVAAQFTKASATDLFQGLVVC